MSEPREGFWEMFFRVTAVFAGFLLLAAFSASISRAAPGERAKAVEKRRRTSLIRHLKRLNRPGDWRIVRKLFSSDINAQRDALRNCPYSDTEWPWYLSSEHMREYTFTADFIPVNMDGDPEDETLIVLQSEPGEINYTTFCLVDDEKRGSTPLSSLNEISHSRPITFQLADLTGDGGSELIVFARDDRSGWMTDSVRIIKPKQDSQFKLVWFGRLRGQFQWPSIEDGAHLGRKVTRSEKLQARMRLSFNGDKSPATIILRGERELTRNVSALNGGSRDVRRSIRKKNFEEHWRWDKKRFRFMRVYSRE